jgi:hypothetical protein
MFSFADHHDIQEWHADLLQWAEHERTARRALKHQSRTRQTTGTALIWLGNRLSHWGQSLHQRQTYAAHDILSD